MNISDTELVARYREWCSEKYGFDFGLNEDPSAADLADFAEWLKARPAPKFTGEEWSFITLFREYAVNYLEDE
jgi:hypothetical protein